MSEDKIVYKQLIGIVELAYQYRGRLWDQYVIYLNNTPDPYPKTFDEWLES
tara:strand:- start:191 stop:343 length:153 start_codon:yes stop_codon:yes gene_type:complete